MNTINARITEITNPSGDYFSVKLKAEENFSWKPGQFAKFELEDMPEKENTRIFSIASTIEEGCILVGTRSRGEDISDFKKKFLNMKIGETVKVTGPMGNFCVQDETTPIVLYASGVGVTPVRALIKSIKDETKREVEIVYASGGYYLYEEDLKAIAENNDKIHISFTCHVEETNEKLGELAKKYKNSAYYYTSGSPFVINAVETLYKELNINDDRLFSDKFMGY